MSTPTNKAYNQGGGKQNAQEGANKMQEQNSNLERMDRHTLGILGNQHDNGLGIETGEHPSKLTNCFL